jgi:hypothetical protein
LHKARAAALGDNTNPAGPLNDDAPAAGKAPMNVDTPPRIMDVSYFAVDIPLNCLVPYMFGGKAGRANAIR